MIDPLLDLKKTAKALDRSVSGVRKMIAARRLEAVKDGWKWKVRESVINDYIKRNTYQTLPRPSRRSFS